MIDTDPLADHAIRQAADDLARTRRHAISLERIAVAIPTFWIAATTFVALGDLPALRVTWAVVVTLSVVAWAALRSVALLLHLRVDDAMILLVDLDTIDPAQVA